jgi:serine/threonine protein kinase
MTPPPEAPQGLPLADLRLIDPVCDRFEAAWRGGQAPRIEDHLPEPTSALYRPLLRELVWLDAHYRRQQGQAPGVGDYAGRFPGLSRAWLAEILQADSAPDTLGEATTPHEGPPRPLPPGTRVAGYELLGELGRGGMGVVYKAEHSLMRRTVALKVISRGLTGDPAAVERFRREVRAAARLGHPNVVQAHDAEQAGELHFLVMEFVEGQSLAGLVEREGPLPVEKACDCVRQAALGLAHALERGLVHRDVKPQNLMLTPGGLVKVLDFGLASVAAERGAEGGLTELGQALGTPDYVAPEQIREARSADTRADVYSLGCTLYFLLAGRPPFPGGSAAEKMAAHLERPPESLAGLRPGLPAELVRVVEKMMTKDPAGRYQTPAEVAAALEPWCRPLAHSSNRPASQDPLAAFRRPGPDRRSRKRWHRVLRQPVFLLAAVVLVPILALATGLGGRHDRNGPEAQQPGKQTPAPLPPPGPRPLNGGAPNPPLAGELILTVWSQKGKGTKKGDRLGLPDTLPVLNGESLRAEVQLNRPAYVYLVWLSSEGKVDPLYPWEPTWGFQSPPVLPPAQGPLPALGCLAGLSLSLPQLPQQPRRQLFSPAELPTELPSGWEMEMGTPPGLDTFVLLARDTPLPNDVDLRRRIGRWPPAPLTDRRQFDWLSIEDGHWVRLDPARPPVRGRRPRPLDEPLVKLLVPLLPHFELLQAVRFSHVEK